MEKIKFAAQIFSLLLALPVLFISATISNSPESEFARDNHDIPAVTRSVEKHKCICKTECHLYKLKLTPASLKN